MSKFTKIMKRIITSIIFIASALNIALAQNEEIEVGKFKIANLCCGADFYLIQSTENKVVISKKDFDNKNFLISEKDGVLNISNNKIGERTATIYFTDLNLVNLSGASEILTKDTILMQNFTINLSGASEADIKINSENLIINSSGASEANIIGKTNHINIVASGASEIKASNLIATNATAVLTGSSEAELNVVNHIQGTLSGASDLDLVSEPTTKNIKTSGSSSVEISNEKATNNSDDTTNLNMGQYQVKIIKKGNSDKTKKDAKFSHSWAGFEFGTNGLMYNNSLNMPSQYEYLELNRGRSWNFGINFLEKDININKEYINLVTGMGIEFANYNLKNNYRLYDNNGLVAIYDSIVHLDKNKLRTSYLNIPLLVEFNTSNVKSKSFHVATGVIGGVRLGSSLKQIETINGKRYKNTLKDDFSMQDFKVMATLRVGYGNFNAFINYGLTDLFKPNKGPNVVPVTLGVTMINF